MRGGLVARSLGSGIAVYTFMAACSSSEHLTDSLMDGGSIDAIADGTGSEMASAIADPLPPDVFIEKCDKTIDFDGTKYWAAAHSFPGKTVAQLSFVRVLFPTAPGDSYTHRLTAPIYFKEGSVAVPCVPQYNGAPPPPQPTFDVTFVSPR